MFALSVEFLKVSVFSIGYQYSKILLKVIHINCSKDQASRSDMKKLGIVGLMLLVLAFWVLPASATPVLYDWAFNINGDMFTAPGTYSGPDPGQLPSYVVDTGFDWNAGLGTISIAYYPAVADDSFLIAFFDHEILEPGNSYFNEFGTISGAVAAGQSWEIDEPGYEFGDIRTYEVWEDPPGDWVEHVGNA